MTGTIHEHMVGDELSVVLIRRSHIDLKTSFFALLRERADDVIRFKTGYFQHGYIHGFQNLLDHRHRLADVFRRLGTLRFVLLVRLMTERAALRIKSHPDMCGVDFLEQVLQRDAKTKDSRGVLPFAVHARRADECIVCAKNHRISIN